MGGKSTEKNKINLAELVKAHIDEVETSIQAVADDIGFSRTAVSLYLSGKYDSDAKELERKLTDYLERETGIRIDTGDDNGQIRKRYEFFDSNDALAILAICKQCQQLRSLGIVIGRSGYGKTHTLRKFAALDRKRVAYVECDDTMGCADLVNSIAMALNMTLASGSIYSKVNAIRHYFNANKGYLLIVDEADKLVNKQTQKKMEILRSIIDQAQVGLIIAGEERLETNLRTYLNRMANRVDCFLCLKGLAGTEVDKYLSDFDVDEDALRELKNRAIGANGCFRLFDRTMNAVIRLLNREGETLITLKTVTEASDRMML